VMRQSPGVNRQKSLETIIRRLALFLVCLKNLVKEMIRKHYWLLAWIGIVAALGIAIGSQAMAQTGLPTSPTRPIATNFFQGRGVAQGAAFTQGRNTNLALTLDGDNFGLELTEIQAASTRGQPIARVQYRGAITRRSDDAANPNSFSLNTRVRSFDSSDNFRIITNTTGTCRIEVFDSRVISSSCNTVADNSSTQFLGLEQF